MPFTLSQPVRTEWPNYVFFNDIFTKEECEKIISLNSKLEMKNAVVGGHQGDGTLVEEKRRSKVGWIEWSPEFDWIFKKISEVVYASNSKWYGFHLSAMNEPFQLTHYSSEDQGHYDWHQDLGPGAHSSRKLSIVVLLSEKESFEGGDLEIFMKGKANEMKQGTAICFPSYEPHRVAPVTKGERWSLVLWVSGPPFA